MIAAPTALSDPEAYLCLRKFSRRLPKCRRTGLPVSFADIGDPDGIPLLWLLPSGCSRWNAVPQDPLCRRYGIRLIAVDRPGVGATPMVPLENRIRLSCEMIVSVLEHLGIKLAHVLATSAGIYFALHLLLNHPGVFHTSLNPPPKLYLIAPWSPLLPRNHPDYYSSHLAWIPDKLIATQHVTLPQLARLSESATSIWDTGTKAVWGSLEYARILITKKSLPPTPPQVEININCEDIPVPVETVSVDENDVDRPRRLWGEFPCCLSCLMEEYCHAENFEGFGQEHLQCLNRGPSDTGPDWLEASVSAVVAGLIDAQTGGQDSIPYPLQVELWWGWQDALVPRPGQLWFNRVITSYPNAIKVNIHDIPDGDHNDLISRLEGGYMVYDMVRQQGQTTASRSSMRGETDM